mmetsp:Transcript_32684/g.76307  ORF Transcript_32684/g.76307 Transcript_32684/m.76307 type:complete len:258 (-) Transcript_32684:231-1004(-)
MGDMNVPTPALSEPGCQRHVAFLVDHEVALPGSVQRPARGDGDQRELGLLAPGLHQVRGRRARQFAILAELWAGDLRLILVDRAGAGQRGRRYGHSRGWGRLPAHHAYAPSPAGAARAGAVTLHPLGIPGIRIALVCQLVLHSHVLVLVPAQGLHRSLRMVEIPLGLAKLPHPQRGLLVRFGIHGDHFHLQCNLQKLLLRLEHFRAEMILHGWLCDHNLLSLRPQPQVGGKRILFELHSGAIQAVNLKRNILPLALQ